MSRSTVQRLVGVAVLLMMHVAVADPVSIARAGAPTNPEPQVPHPRRFQWLKRLSLFCVLLLAVLVGVRLWWGRMAEARLREALERIVAAGDPVNGRQLNPGPLAPEDNAAAYLQRALSGAIKFNDTPSATSYSFTYPPYGNQWDALAEKSVKMNAGIFPLARQARAHERADWGTRMVRPAVATMLPYLNGARHLANTLGDAAEYAHFRGDDAAALETIRDVRGLARAAGADGFLVCHLVGIGIEAVADARLQVIATRLRVAPEGAATPVSGLYPSAARAMLQRPASREQVRALVGELLDEREFADALRHSFAVERATQLDMVEWFADQSYALRPMFQLDGLRMLEQDEAPLAAARQPNWPAARAVLAAARPPLPPPVPGGAVMFGPVARGAKRRPIDYARVLSDSLVAGSSFGRSIEQHMRVRAERRMCAVTLAVQLYRADHAGRWPPTLDALVPQYLPQVPRDPLAAGDKPLGYVILKGAIPDGSDRPLVYSVGPNGVDDTAAGTMPGKTPYYDWSSTRDQWRDMTRWSPFVPSTQPATAPSTQAGDHQPDEADDPGEGE